MAIWQYMLWLLPRNEFLKANGGSLPFYWDLITKLREMDENPELYRPQIEIIHKAIALYWAASEYNKIDYIGGLIDGFIERKPFERSLVEREPYLGTGFYSWGIEGRNYIFITFNYETQIVQNIEIFIDLRYYPKAFANNVLRLANDLDCLIMDFDNGKVFEPKYENLKQEVEKSDAYKFIMNLD